MSLVATAHHSPQLLKEFNLELKFYLVLPLVDIAYLKWFFYNTCPWSVLWWFRLHRKDCRGLSIVNKHVCIFSPMSPILDVHSRVFQVEYLHYPLVLHRTTPCQQMCIRLCVQTSSWLCSHFLVIADFFCYLHISTLLRCPHLPIESCRKEGQQWNCIAAPKFPIGLHHVVENIEMRPIPILDDQTIDHIHRIGRDSKRYVFNGTGSKNYKS